MKHIMWKTTLVICSAAVGAQAAIAAQNDAFSDTDPMAAAIHVTRLDYSKFDSPEAVTVVTQEDIRNSGYLDISDVFRSVPGFRLVKIGAETRVSYHGTTVRQNRRLRVTINGKNILIGDGEYVEFDRLPITIEDVSRIVITRGPNGVSFGDNAFLANIDIQTIGRSDPRFSSARVAAGYNGRSKYSLASNEDIGGVHIATSIGGEFNRGYQYRDENETPRNSKKQIYRGQLTLSGDVTDHSLIEFNASAYDSESQIGILDQTGQNNSTGQFFQLSNKIELGEQSRLDWSIGHNSQKQLQRQYGCFTPITLNAWLGAITSPALRGSLLGAVSAVSSGLGVPPSDACFFNDHNIGSRRTDAEVEFESRIGGWRYLGGASATQITATSEQYFNGIEQEQKTYRVFAESSYAIRAFNFNLGGMGQQSSNVDDRQFAGRGGVNWHVTPNQTVRYTFAESFRVPSLVESVTLWNASFCFRRRSEPLNQVDLCRGPPVIASNTIINPERITSNSVGYFGSFLGSGLTVDVKLFHDTVRNPITSNWFFFSPPPSNGKKFILQGAETEASLRVTPNISIKGSYSYLENDATQSIELGMQGNNAGSLGVVYNPATNQSLSLSYYGNSALSGNDYSRADAAYSYLRAIGKAMLKVQVVYQHHFSNKDGIDSRGTFGADEGVYEHSNQIFGLVELGF